MKSQNPFNTGSPARGEGFFGRQEIIDDILLFLEKKNEFNFVIFGQRRIGKTSLLRKLQDDENMKEKAYPVYFNLQDKARTPLPQLLFEIARRIDIDLELKLDVHENDFLNDKGKLHFKDIFLPAACAKLKNSSPLLLLFDEFDVLGDIEDVEEDATISTFAFRSFIPFMVNLLEEIHQNKLPVKFIFAVGRNYKDLDPKRYGQVLKFGPQREITYFSKEKTREFLEKHSLIPFSKEAIDELFSLTGGHPYFTQCLASAAFDRANKKDNKEISKGIVNNEFIPTIKSFSSGVYWVWDSLSAHDQIVLYLMAVLKEEGKPLNRTTIKEKAFSLNFAPAVEKLDEALEKLEHFKFIKKGKKGYDFYVEFMRKWIVQEVTESDIAKNLGDIDEEIELQLHNGRYYFRHGEYKQAAGHYETILKKSPYHFEALLYLARSYKNLIEEDNKYIEKSLSVYQRAFLVNKRKSQKEYLDLLHESREYLEEKSLYDRFKPEALEETIKKITALSARLAEMGKLRKESGEIAKKRVEWIGGVVFILFVGSIYLLAGKGLERNKGLLYIIFFFIMVFSFLSALFNFSISTFLIKRLKKRRYLKFGCTDDAYKTLQEELEEAEKL